jgi:hypothetical protein
MSRRHDEAFKKAVACEVHARQAPDELLRDKFRRLRDSWLSIANAAQIIRAQDEKQ